MFDPCQMQDHAYSQTHLSRSTVLTMATSLAPAPMSQADSISSHVVPPQPSVPGISDVNLDDVYWAVNSSRVNVPSSTAAILSTSPNSPQDYTLMPDESERAHPTLPGSSPSPASSIGGVQASTPLESLGVSQNPVVPFSSPRVAPSVIQSSTSRAVDIL